VRKLRDKLVVMEDSRNYIVALLLFQFSPNGAGAGAGGR